MFEISLPKFALKTLIFLSLLATVSCLSQEDGPSKIRIVDLNGKVKEVRTFVPEGNIQALSSQNNQANNYAPVVDNSQANLGQRQQNQAPSNLPRAVSNQIIEPQLTQIQPVNNYQAAPNSQPTSEVSYVQNNVQPNSQPANEQYQKNYQKPISLNYAPKPSKKYKFATQSQVKQALQPTIQPKITTPQYSQNQPAISNQKNPQPASVKQNITPSYLVDNSGKFVQIGSFSVMSNANNVLKKASSISGGMIEEADLIGGRKIYRVMLGPIKGSTKINQVLNQAKQIGYSDAFIVK